MRLNFLRVFLFVLLVGPSTGCVSVWWNDFLDPTEVGNFREFNVQEIQKSISFRDKPYGIPGATEPTPEDLVARVEDYRIGPGDSISVRMLDFLVRDTESVFEPVTVSDLGYIYITQLGWIKVEGLNEREVQETLIQRAKAAGIYREDSTPAVVVQFLSQQHRIYNVSGATASPGAFRIPRPDFRLREAINQTGAGLDEEVKVIYVIRNEPRYKRVVDQPPPEGLPGTTGPRSAGTEGAGAAPPVVPPPAEIQPGSMTDFSSGSATVLAQANPQPAPQGANGGLALPPDEAERELMEAVAPRPGETPAETPPSPQPANPGPQNGPSPAGTPGVQPFIFDGEQFVESTGTAPAGAPAAGQQVAPPAQPGEPVDWQELATTGEQRVIRIPAWRLRQGDPAVNIVIQHQDWIRLDRGPVGVFYMMGHVTRPGVYALAGQEMTLRQAIASAGGLDPLAWPTRCEIVRRIDDDVQEITQWNLERIMAGQDPDLYIKPEDVINMGTNAIAPLLATIRNAFRLTYGFGFVYDRNFADIDAYFSKTNPESLRQQRLAQRFPGLFP